MIPALALMLAAYCIPRLFTDAMRFTWESAEFDKTSHGSARASARDVPRSFTGSIGRGYNQISRGNRWCRRKAGAKRLAAFDLLASPADRLAFLIGDVLGKTLVIAEKPSVAQDIVKALTPVAGKFEKHDEHFESERFVVTSAVGHLVEIQAPEEFDVKRGKWSFAHLPVIPPVLRPQTRRPHKDPARGRRATGPASGRDRARQRVRRGARGRADLPGDRAVRERQETAEQAGTPAVAAVDDAAGDPRRVRALAATRRYTGSPTPRGRDPKPTGSSA